MKKIILFYFNQQLIASQGADNPTIRECAIGSAIELELNGGNTAEWFVDFVTTVDALLEQRRRCNEIVNDRIRETCLLTLRAQVIFEAFRLRNDLQALVGDEVSQKFFEKFLLCFGINPNDPDVTPPPPADASTVAYKN